MGELSLFTVNLLVPLAIVATLTKSSYARCLDKPVVEDSCYAETTGTLVWNPPQSCSNVNSYEVMYTKAMCSTTGANVETVNLTNETTVFMTSSSEVYCIQVRAVINENCYSRYSTCAQVASLEKDQVFNLSMYGELCIPVSLCQQDHTSKIILSNSQEHFHLIWGELELRHNVNRTYDIRTNTSYFCFHNVTEDFLFLEYCDVMRAQSCESDSTFCCGVWADFVSRTRVNVAGNRDGGCSESLLPLIQLDVITLPTSRVSTAADTTSITQHSISPYTSVMSSSTPVATPNTPPDDNLVKVLGIVLPIASIGTIFVVTLTVFCCYRHLKNKQHNTAKRSNMQQPKLELEPRSHEDMTSATVVHS